MYASLIKSSPQNEADRKAKKGGWLSWREPWKLMSQRMGCKERKGGWILRPRLRRQPMTFQWSSRLFPSQSVQLVQTLGRGQQAIARCLAELEVREGTR